jgi:hypothetical protein
MQAVLNELALNLLAGARLALFLPIRREHFAVERRQVLAVLAVGFIVTLAAQWLLRSPERDGAGFLPTYALATVILLAFSAFALTLFMRQHKVLVPALIVLASPLPVLSLALMLLSPWVAPPEATATAAEDPAAAAMVASFAVAVWQLAANYRALRLIFAANVAATLPLLILIVLLQIPLGLMKGVYYYGTEEAQLRAEADAEAETDAAATDGATAAAGFGGYSLEDLYYMQQPKLWSAMQELTRQRPGVVDLYYIGFASSSDADVYRREVEHSKQLLDERFDTARHSFLLVNHRETISDLPIASHHGLSWALGWLSDIMDVNEDVLFLHLAAASARDTLAIDLPPLPMDGMTAPQLKGMLDGQGFKWRVIVVSACRFGEFAQALADDNSLIVAAADNHLNAHGCEAGRDFTEFGDAYFNRALRSEYSFVKAFEMARESIASEESAGGRKPSQPQLFLGNAIAAKLAALEARLRERKLAN